jgi:hypothetical protein
MATEHPNPTDWRTDAAAVAAYVQAIEGWFVELRGRGVQWSPTDAARAQSWYAMGVPLGTVLRVLRARAKAWRYQHGDDARLPVGLAWYDKAILEQHRHLARLGRPAQVPSPTQETGLDAELPPDEATLTDLLDPLPELAESAAHPVIAHAYRKAHGWLDKQLHPPKDTDPADHEPPGDLDAQIDRCQAVLRRTVLAGLEDSEMALVDAAIDAQLKPFIGQLGRKALLGRRQALLDRELAARFGLRMPTRAGWVDPRDV